MREYIQYTKYIPTLKKNGLSPILSLPPRQEIFVLGKRCAAKLNVSLHLYALEDLGVQVVGQKFLPDQSHLEVIVLRTREPVSDLHHDNLLHCHFLAFLVFFRVLCSLPVIIIILISKQNTMENLANLQPI